MKLIYSILKITAIGVIVAVITLFFASFIMQDTVAGIILRSLNRDISTKYEFRSVRLSYLKKFPKASLDLKNVLVHSSGGFDRTCFGDTYTDTLLSAKSVTVEFSITDVARGIYDIDRISVRDGKLILLSDTAGRVNYDIYIDNGKDSSSESFILNLERINASGLTAIYNNAATRLVIKGIIENGRIKSKITNNDIDFAADGKLRIDLFRLYSFSITRSTPADVNVNLFSSDKGVRFGKSTLRLDKYLFSLSGFVSSDDVLDLTLNGSDLDIAFLQNYVPDKVRGKIADYNPSGTMDIRSTFRGLVSRTANPNIKIDFNVRNGNVAYGNSALKISDLSFSGSFTNGSEMIPSTSSLSISNFTGTLGSSQYTGSLLLSDFDAFRAKLQLKGLVKPAEIREFFRISDISSASGSIDLDLKLDGMIPERGKYTLSDFFSLQPDADMKFNAFNIGVKNDRFRVNDVSGQLLLSDTLVANDLKFSVRDQNFSFTGMLFNFPGWIAGSPVILRGNGELHCSDLMPEVLFPSLASPDSVSGNQQSMLMPGDIIIDASVSIDHLAYKTFEAKNISGSLSYKPGILNFKTLKLNTLDGTVSGNGFLVQNSDKSFIGRGTFALDNIDINKTFVSFRNFGQGFIKAENLAGALSGSLSVLIPMDSLYHPIIKAITAEGKYIIVNGSLIEFDPIKELSSFISINELRNIHFEKLENDFFIRSNYFYMPQMDVRSSAADLSVNGKHNFDNDYEYHIKILLSEALSKNIRKPKPNTTEFGAVQDDGLGRTSLLLKMEGNSEDLKVSYDVKAAGAKVRNEIKTEKQNLKTILNQEFGWYKNDTAVAKPAASKPKRFRITWEETDTIK